MTDDEPDKLPEPEGAPQVRHLQFRGDDSKKYWAARLTGTKLLVQWGRIGSTATTKLHRFATPAAAEAEFARLVASKLRKGYRDAPPGG